MHLRPRRAERRGEVALIRRRGRRRRGERGFGEARLRRLGEPRRRGRGAPVPAGVVGGSPIGWRRPHGEDRRRPAGGRRPMQRLVQALLDRPDDEAPDDGGVAKAHLGLGRMDVDVDLARIALDEQGRDRMPVGGQEIEVGPAQRAGQRLVAHRPPVDEQELLGGVRPAEGRQAHPAGKPRALASRVEPNRIQAEVVAERLAQPFGEARFALASGRPVERRADVACERKAHVRRGHRQPLDRIGRGQRLSPVGFEELEPRGGGGEEIARLDPRPDRRGAGFDRALSPVLDHEPQARRRARARECGFRAATPRRSRAAPRRGSRRSRSRSDRRREFSTSRAARRSRRDRLRPCPRPSSTTRISLRPPASIATSIVFAPASSAFSTSSLIAAAGRSITSPAAMRSIDKRIETANRHGGGPRRTYCI